MPLDPLTLLIPRETAGLLRCASPTDLHSQGQDNSPLLKKVLTMKLKEMEETAKQARKTSTSEGSLCASTATFFFTCAAIPLAGGGGSEQGRGDKTRKSLKLSQPQMELVRVGEGLHQSSLPKGQTPQPKP